MKSTLKINTIECQPYQDQKPGTAGLRKKVSVVRQDHYLETYVQSVFNSLSLPDDATLVLGGDGRYYNNEAIHTIIAIAVANGVRHLIIGRDGLLSTPAASHLIRKHQAFGGFILTASHNPGGPDGDFGIKYNTGNGGQAPEALTDTIYATSKNINSYRIADLPDIDLNATGSHRLDALQIEIVDSVSDYSSLVQSIFDFDCMAAAIANNLRIRFDALHGITGPYAQHIFGELLGTPTDDILNSTPLPDFGGGHPDPNPVDVPGLIADSLSPDSPDLLAASDGDGDRNMIVLPGQMVSPCDSLAIMLANAREIPGYRNGMPGVARSMPTSMAADRVAAELNIPCYETPTGWRFFCNLLDSGAIGLCGEESFGTGSSHVREKDGLWAILFWLNLLATTGKSGGQILNEHWHHYGRDYYQRYDYFIEDTAAADELFNSLRSDPMNIAKRLPQNKTLTAADSFTYHDPVDHSISENQGVRFSFADQSRIVYRLSGTGTSGATLRVYLQHFEADAQKQTLNQTEVLQPLGAIASHLADIERITGLSRPTAII